MISMNAFSLLAAFTFLANIHLSHAGLYMWDKSCNSSGKDNDPQLKFLKDSFTNSLKMSQAGYDQMLPSSGSVASGVSDALALLFGPTIAGKGNRALAAANLVFGAKGANRLTTEVFNNEALTDERSNNVKFYCDLKRIQPHTVYPNIWFDEDVNAELTPQDLAGFSCDPTQGDKSLMFTRRIVDVDFYQIQICPFYLNSALPSQAKYQWTTNLLGSAANFVKSVSVNAVRLVAERDYTEIDAFALFDKVLLHELTHANFLWHTEDIIYNGVKTYGFKLGVELAANVITDTAAEPPVYGPEYNADSWALMGSICYGISEGTMSGVDEDGNILKLDGTGPSKLRLRDVLDGLDSKHLLAGVSVL